MRLRQGEKSQKGFTIVELMVALVISGVILVCVYRLWLSNHTETMKLQNKMDIRNQLGISSKRLQNAITMAGYGLTDLSNLEKSDAVGSDTLVVWYNKSQAQTKLTLDYLQGLNFVMVENTAGMVPGAYIGMANGSTGEFRKIRVVNGNLIELHMGFNYDYSMSNTKIFPATMESFYTDQAKNRMVCVVNDTSIYLAKNIKNFQVGFLNKQGVSTSDLRDVRTVTFSLTGIHSAKEGALNSINFTTTVIPRNLI